MVIRATRFLIKKSLALAAAGVIVLALLIQLGRSVAAGDYREQLAEYLSQALQSNVQIEAFSADWQGLRPALLLSGVDIKTPAGDAMLQVERVDAELSLLRSVLNGRVVWNRLLLDGAAFHMQQADDGRWSLVGLPLQVAAPELDAEGEPLINSPADIFFYGRHIELANTQLSFDFRSGHSMDLRVPNILLENSLDYHRATANLDLDGRQDVVRAVLEIQGDLTRREQLRTKGYLKIDQLPTEKPLAALAKQLWQGRADKQWRDDGLLSLEAWFDSASSGGVDIKGQLSLSDLPALFTQVDDLENSEQLNNVSADLTGFWRPSGECQLNLQQLQWRWGPQQGPSFNARIGHSLEANRWTAAIDNLELAPWYAMLEGRPLLGERLAAVLAKLEPEGNLKNLQFSWPAGNLSNFKLQANLQQVSVGPWGGAPGLTQVDGYLEASKTGGWIDLDSRAGFSMFYDTVYEAPMEYRQARGQVAWWLQPDNNAIYVNSGPLALQGEDGEADGFLHLYFPWQKGSARSEMILQIGLQNSRARYHKKYVPKVVPENLLRWLDSSLDQGDVSRAGFIYRGSLGKGDADHRDIQLFIDLANASLDYHPQWPAISDGEGHLLLDGSELQVDLSRGRIFDSRLEDVRVTLTTNPLGQGQQLDIDGRLQGPAEDGLRVLRESALRQVLGDSFDSWHLQGQMSASLDLTVPLNHDELGAAQRVEVELAGNELTMGSLNLTFSDINGRLHYSDEQGLTAESIAANLWQQPLELAISSEANGGGEPEAALFSAGQRDTRVSFTGQTDARPLARWAKRPELLFLEGALPYRGSVLLPSKSSARRAEFTEQLGEPPQALLEVESDLQGVAVDLPEPFGKVVADTVPVRLQVPIAASRSLYRLSYADLWQGLFLQRQGFLNRANVALFSEAQLPEEEYLLVSGVVDRIELPEWQSVLDRYVDYQAQLQPLTDEPAEQFSEVQEASSLRRRLELQVGQLQLGEFSVSGLAVAGEVTDETWQLQLQSELLAGRLQVTESRVAPNLKLALDYLHLPDSDVAGVDIGTELAPELESAVEQLDSDSLESKPQSQLAISGVAEDKGEPLLLSSSSLAEPVRVDPLASVAPGDLPALTFSVDDLRLGDDDFGRWSFVLNPNDTGLILSDLRAEIRGLTLTGPEHSGAQLSWWERDGEIRTEFKGELSFADAGQLMQSWQQPALLESRNGQLQADLSWLGSPANINLLALKGRLDVDINKGRYNRSAGTGSDAVLRLLGLMNFDSWARRLQFDFSDLYKKGMAYDRLQGRLDFEEGMLHLNQPLRLKTPSSRLQMAGHIDLRREEIDASLVATLPVSGNATLITALIAGLPVAAGVYIASKLFQEQVDKVASISYDIEGSWDDPKVEFRKLFDQKAAERKAEGLSAQ